jgi:hypothetical protein
VNTPSTFDALKAMLQFIDVNTAKQLASKVFNHCGIETCDKHSLGINCGSCSRFVCNAHVYFRMGAPPVPICAACVLDSHPDLFEDS